MGKGMHGGDCGERDEGRGLWGKEMQGGDCGEREEGKGLWGKGCKAGTVWKCMQGRDHGGRDPGSLVNKDLKTNEISAAARKAWPFALWSRSCSLFQRTGTASHSKLCQI